ncbi:MAG TPA: hypothetical protein VFU38_00970 [Candidatus Krumholzibacteria bacterium]|nr:hypothetical protein [Candidatus Krumholzibacteria bacterium]
MDDFFMRLGDALSARLDGPMKFRLVIQPVVAAFFAIRAGLADARNGRPPFFWTVLTNRDSRAAMLKDGWKDIAKVFTMAVVMDLVYQFIVARDVRVASALVLAALLCFVPYIVLRGPVNRLARRGKS